MPTWNRPLNECLFCPTAPVDLDEHYRKCPQGGIVWPYSERAVEVEHDRILADREYTKTEERIEARRKAGA